jgi:hypothetical protein
VTACTPPSSGISITLLPNPLVFHFGPNTCPTKQVYQLVPHVFPSGINQAAKFSSPLNGVITLSPGGLVSPVKVGTTTATAIALADTTAQASIAVNVDSQECIIASAGTIITTMKPGSHQQLSTNPANLVGTWVASRASIASVNSENGMVTAASSVSAPANVSICFERLDATYVGCVTLTISP